MGQNGHSNFFYGKRKQKSSIGNRIFCTQNSIRVGFVSSTMLCIVLRVRWCNIIVLNVRATSEEESDNSKDSFCEELEQVCDHFPKYHMKNLLGDFNAKVGRENSFKPTIGNESLHQGSNDNGI